MSKLAIASFKFNFFVSLTCCAFFCANAGIVNTKSIATQTKNEFHYLARFQCKHLIESICSGVIISDRHILTSSLCGKKIERWSKNDIVAILGSPELLQNSDQFYAVSIENVIWHTDFHAESQHNDLVVLTTTEKILFSDAVRPIDLPKADVTNENGLSVFVPGLEINDVRKTINHQKTIHCDCYSLAHFLNIFKNHRIWMTTPTIHFQIYNI